MKRMKSGLLSKEAAWNMYSAGIEIAAKTCYGTPSVEKAFKVGFDAGRGTLVPKALKGLKR